MDAKEKEQLFQKLDVLIHDLAYEHQSIYYVLPKEDEGVCYKENPHIPNGLNQKETFPFCATAFAYGNTFVDKRDREEFLCFIKAKSMEEKLENNVVISCNYRAHYENKTIFHTIQAMRTLVGKNKDGLLVCISGGSRTREDCLLEARENEKTRSEYLARLSHEIRTPLNAIAGLDAMALKETSLSKIRNYLKRIRKAVSYILNIINDVLDIEKIKEKKYQIKAAPFCLKKLTKEVTSLLEPECIEKGIHPEIKIDPLLKDFYLGDETKIKEVLINILNNALRYSENGKRVALLIKKEKEGIALRITDEGAGIKEEALTKIFEPFWQEKEEKGSSGLGLYLSKELVNAMGGEIKVESKVGKGTSFTIWLPLETAKEIKEKKKEDLNLKGRKILVAEDVDINREILAFQLKEKGMRCELVSNGKEALEHFKKSKGNEYDLILMDVHMPVMDGISAAKQIRKLERKDNDIPIVAISADGFEEDEEESRKAGMNVHLRKPVDPNLLYETIQRLLDL